MKDKKIVSNLTQEQCIEMVRQAIQKGIDSGIDYNFDFKKHLAELNEKYGC